MERLPNHQPKHTCAFTETIKPGVIAFVDALRTWVAKTGDVPGGTLNFETDLGVIVIDLSRLGVAGATSGGGGSATEHSESA